ncbi:nitrite reductase 1 [Klebsormidium nitens]|uniref:Ferredoxin--nitrite reductase, chloroplastic n=1 Tax=Klebsormidium nitens TaxID=105231 RepID=A0A1Y1I434_KLENI|nr:nitrite reductase 1 [Klebsormidium nitens]|eukprot:GAQ84712.1 nitrite reductase 1 [Klebsormidium nitens]
MKAATLTRTGVSQTPAGFAANPHAALGPQFAGLRAMPLPKKAAPCAAPPQNRASVISATEKVPEKKPRDVAAKAVATAPPPPMQGESAPPQVDAERLVPRVAKNEEGFWELKKEFQASLNPAEKIKLGAEPMKLFTEMRIKDLAEQGFAEVDKTKEGKDDIDVRLKWMGLFHRRKRTPGRFMMRLKIPNGIVTAKQTAYLASVIAKYGADGCADITTRQNYQLRGILLEDVPEIMKGFEEHGLSAIQSGMDNVRNGVGSPLAGIDPEEILDTIPYNIALNDYINNNKKGNLDITNLPRKWNVAVVGTHDLYEHPHINDLAYMPATKDGVLGFNILVGGFFSQKRCAEAIPMDAWVPSDDVVPLCKAVLEAFRDLGSRANRQKARMMWLIDEIGLEAFREEVAKRMPTGTIPRAGTDMVDPTWKRRSYFGVNKQKQAGLNFVGVLVPVGRLQADDMFEFARVAEEYGSGELRMTVEQNFIIPNVPDDKVEAFLADPLFKKFTPFPSNLSANLVSCTGSQFCGVALIETKNRALDITAQLEASLDVPTPVRMHWTGCPNTCGQVQVADIGFMGAAARDENKKPCEGVDIFLGGRIGSDSHLGECVKKGVPVSQLVPVVEELLMTHFGATRKAVAA